MEKRKLKLTFNLANLVFFSSHMLWFLDLAGGKKLWCLVFMLVYSIYSMEMEKVKERKEEFLACYICWDFVYLKRRVTCQMMQIKIWS